MKFTKEECHALYLEWLNNYLTDSLFAEHYQLGMTEVENILDIGRKENRKIAEKVYQDTGKIKQNSTTLNELSDKFKNIGIYTIKN
tara:strand:+ start:2235 stop:2492 length:258 start_codon:yes stop_codon:yes gene_type:complete